MTSTVLRYTLSALAALVLVHAFGSSPASAQKVMMFVNASQADPGTHAERRGTKVNATQQKAKKGSTATSVEKELYGAVQTLSRYVDP